MERLTKREGAHAHFPECFEEPCEGVGCQKGSCNFLNRVCNKLCDFEDKLENGELKESKHGRWELTPDRGFFRRTSLNWRCSSCGTQSLANGKEKYCHGCGSFMDDKKQSKAGVTDGSL